MTLNVICSFVSPTCELFKSGLFVLVEDALGLGVHLDDQTLVVANGHLPVVQDPDGTEPCVGVSVLAETKGLKNINVERIGTPTH